MTDLDPDVLCLHKHLSSNMESAVDPDIHSAATVAPHTCAAPGSAQRSPARRWLSCRARPARLRSPSPPVPARPSRPMSMRVRRIAASGPARLPGPSAERRLHGSSAGVSGAAAGRRPAPALALGRRRRPFPGPFPRCALSAPAPAAERALVEPWEGPGVAASPTAVRSGSAPQPRPPRAGGLGQVPLRPPGVQGVPARVRPGALLTPRCPRLPWSSRVGVLGGLVDTSGLGGCWRRVA